MGKQGIAAGGNDALHRVRLMRLQAPSSPQAVDSQGASVVGRVYQIVVGLVVEVFQILCPLCVFPKPFLKFLRDFFDLLIRRRRCHLIDNGSAFRVLIGYFDAAAVQHGFKQVQEGPRRGSPFLRVPVVSFDSLLGPLIREVEGEVSGLVAPVHHHTAIAENVVGESAVDGFRNPRRTWLHENLFMWHIFRHDGFQRVNVVLIILVSHGQRLRVAEFCADIARQINLCRFQLPVTVLECQFRVDQLPRHFLRGLPGETGNQVNIDAAGGVPGNDKAVLYCFGAGDSAVRLHGIL